MLRVGSRFISHTVNGVGLPDRLDIKNTDSLGLQLVKTITEHQLSGSFKVDNKNGAKFTIRFNINEA